MNYMMPPEERQELIPEFTHALACSQPVQQLTDEEVQCVKLAIEAESQARVERTSPPVAQGVTLTATL